MWTDKNGKQSEDPNDFAEDIGKAVLETVGTTGGCTFTKSINNMTVQDFQARPMWYANWHSPENEDGA